MISEPENINNLFYTCSLIELIARITKNTKKKIIEELGDSNLQKIYNLADIYHYENIMSVAVNFIQENNIGRIYIRLIAKINNKPNTFINTLKKLLTSWLIEKIDNYRTVFITKIQIIF